MTATAHKAEQPSSQQAYSIESFGRAFNVGRSMIYEEIRTGRLKARKVGARTLIAHEDAIEWLNSLPQRTARPMV